MKGAREAAMGPGSTSVRHSKMTEETLVRLLQDDVKWELQPLVCVEELLSMLEHIDDATVDESSERREYTRSLVDDEACLTALQEWLKNHSNCAQNDKQEEDWKFSSTGMHLDSKGSR